MFSPSEEDVRELRNDLLRQFRMANSQVNLASELYNKEFDIMVERLEKVSAEFWEIWDNLSAADINTEREQQVARVFKELNAMRIFFCAPLVRPIPQEAMSYISHAHNALFPMIKMTGSVILYAELLRTLFCGVEYCICNGENPDEYLASLVLMLDEAVTVRDSSESTDLLFEEICQINECLIDYQNKTDSEETIYLIDKIYFKIACITQGLSFSKEDVSQVLYEGVALAAYRRIIETRSDKDFMMMARRAIEAVWEADMHEAIRKVLALAYQIVEEYYD